MASRGGGRGKGRETTRRALIRAGIAETIDRGGVGTPVIEAICRRAGYTRGAFYAHFRDRTDFVVAMMESVLRDVIGAVFETPQRGTADLQNTLRRFTDQLAAGDLSGITDARALYLGLMEAVQRSQKIRAQHARFMEGMLDTLEAAAREGQARGQVRRDIAPRELADTLMLIVIGLVMWDRIEIPLDVGAIRDALLRLVTSEPLRLAEPRDGPAAPKRCTAKEAEPPTRGTPRRRGPRR